MKADPDDLKVNDVLQLKFNQMLIVNPEYQRGAVWTQAQKKRLVDSVLRGYPIPLIYLHHIRQAAGKLVAERYEIIDGQQRINALSDFVDGAFKLFDPEKDAAEARFPEFIKKRPCPWGRCSFRELGEHKEKLLNTVLRIVKIESEDPNEARDLFVRLQAGMPLTSQEKRDAWPGEFTDFVLRLGGKPGLARYPGHDFFNVLMRAQKVQDRGKFRQLAAQLAMLYFGKRGREASFCDINAEAIDDFYYENLAFNSDSQDALRLFEVLDKITRLLRDQKRPKIIGHEAIHLVLFVDALVDDYTHSWEARFAFAFDDFREKLARAKLTRDDPNPSEYWLRYGVYTRVNSDRGENIQRRHEFFCVKMREALQPQRKDPQRLFGALERELVYYRDKKKCAVCGEDVIWSEVDIHHVEEHAKGGTTTLENAVLVHRDHHPKGSRAAEFTKRWRERLSREGSRDDSARGADASGDEENDENSEDAV
jgi:hypothetical protein